MHVDALQEDRFAVEQDARAVDANIAKSDVIGDLVFAGGEVYFVELWRLGRPERKPGSLDAEWCISISTCLRTDFGTGFRHFYGNGCSRRSAEHMDIASEFGI